jgi:hypothetical protein
LVATVSSSTSSASGIAGLASVGTGGRAPIASQVGATVEASVAQNGVGFDSGTGTGRGGANLPDQVASTFAAQLFVQEGGGAALTAPPRSSQQVASTYQNTAQVEANASADVQIPGLPTPLASGRVLDLTA